MRADFSFSDNFGQKMCLKEGYAEKKMFSYAISRSSKVNQGHFGLSIFFVSPLAIMWSKMMRI